MPVFLLEKSHEQRSLVGYGRWEHKKLDMTEVTEHKHTHTHSQHLYHSKVENEKVGLKVHIQKTKIMPSSPITSWQIDEETMETVRDFFSWAPKSLQILTAAIKLKRHLLLGRKVMTNLDSILTSRDITLLTKVRLVKATSFSSSHVWM